MKPYAPDPQILELLPRPEMLRRDGSLNEGILNGGSGADTRIKQHDAQTNWRDLSAFADLAFGA